MDVRREISTAGVLVTRRELTIVGAVASPGGTTAAGLRELERHGVREALLEAVLAGAARLRELGG